MPIGIRLAKLTLRRPRPKLFKLKRLGSPCTPIILSSLAFPQDRVSLAPLFNHPVKLLRALDHRQGSLRLVAMTAT